MLDRSSVVTFAPKCLERFQTRCSTQPFDVWSRSLKHPGVEHQLCCSTNHGQVVLEQVRSNTGPSPKNFTIVFKRCDESSASKSIQNCSRVGDKVRKSTRVAFVRAVGLSSEGNHFLLGCTNDWRRNDLGKCKLRSTKTIE